MRTRTPGAGGRARSLRHVPQSQHMKAQARVAGKGMLCRYLCVCQVHSGPPPVLALPVLASPVLALPVLASPVLASPTPLLRLCLLIVPMVLP